MDAYRPQRSVLMLALNDPSLPRATAFCSSAKNIFTVAGA